MTINPLKYSSLSKGTINLGGSDSSSEETTEKKSASKKSKKSSSKSEDSYVDIDFTGEIENLAKTAKKQSDNFKSLISNVISSYKTQMEALAQSAQASVETVVSEVEQAISPAVGSTVDAVSEFSGTNADLVKKFNSKFKGALAGKGALIVSAATANGISPVLLASIMALETGWGTSKAVNKQNNPGGIMDAKTNWMKIKSFSSLEEGISAMASNLKKNYIDKGLTTISAIGNKYCPVGAANDPNGTNGGWIPAVTQIFNQLSA